MRHVRDPAFKPLFDALPQDIQDLAKKNFALLKMNPRHPSLRFKPLRANAWSARIGRNYRAVAAKRGDLYVWFWIGPHDEYDKLVASL